LREVNTICSRSWHIAAHIWKIYDFKIEVPFIIKKIHEARAFNFTYRYIDDVLSINNSRFAEFLPLIYPPELEVKETTDAYVIDEELQHTDHLFLGIACFTFLNFV
jgi:hypothetical protein